MATAYVDGMKDVSGDGNNSNSNNNNNNNNNQIINSNHDDGSSSSSGGDGKGKKEESGDYNGNDDDFLKLWQDSKVELISTHAQRIYLPCAKTKAEEANVVDGGNMDSEVSPYTFRVSQLRGVQQPSGDQSCGYYCIYYASLLTQIFEGRLNREHTTSEETIKGWMFKIYDKSSYTQFKQEIMDHLLQECIECEKREGRTCYPWEKPHVETGLLERAYLQWLQGYKPLINDNNPCVADKYHFAYETDMINLLEFGTSSLKTNHLPIRAIEQCERFFEEFHKPIANKKRTMVAKTFLIGSAIHYVICGLLRDDVQKTIDVVYIDPQNYDIIHRSGGYLTEKIIPTMKFESWLQMGWQRSDMERLAFDSLTGIQSAIDLIIQGVIRHDDLYFGRMHLLQMNLIEGFLNTFDLHVLAPMTKKLASLTTATTNETKEQEKEEKTIEEPKDGWFVGVVRQHDIKKNVEESEKKEEAKTAHDNNSNGLADLLMQNFQKCIDYTLEIIETVPQHNSNNSNNDNEQMKLKEKKEFYQYGAQLIEKWSLNYYPAGIIDSNVSAMLSRLQPHIPRQVLILLNQWSKLMVLFSTEQYRRVMGIENDTFWYRFATSLVVLSFVCQHSMKLLRLTKSSSQVIQV